MRKVQPAFGFALVCFSVFQISTAQAQFVPPIEERGGDDTYTQYYAVHDPLKPASGFRGPQELWGDLEKTSSDLIKLLQFDFSQRPLPMPREPYSRRQHFGDWVDDPRDTNCYNTRAKVLMRDSTRPVVFRSNPCVVDAGEWHEPYLGKTHRLAKDVQIDHLVALSNAYTTGASYWSWPMRCLYANYLGNAFHLVTADGRANASKGARTPADWMPQNRAVTCQYLSFWLRVKLIWGLALGMREATAIQNLARSSGCSVEDFNYSESELKNQRQIMAANMDLCSRLRPRIEAEPAP